MTERPFWFWCVVPALAMSLGWGLRGSIGGGSLGAMIPGAMIGLVLCLLLGRERDAALVAALGAVGVGFGGQETYGQTVGLIRVPETFWWAFVGFGVKGAVWGLLGGAFLGLALDPPEKRRVLIGLALMVITTWLGWKFLDDPKYIYFSNRLDKPRPEIWAGLWAGGLALLLWVRARVPSLFALYGAIAGGIGFAFGAALQPWGTALWKEMPLGWWKAMELTFGALLGLSYGLCAWRLRGSLRGQNYEAKPISVPAAVIAAFIASAVAFGSDEFLKVRFGYTIGGAVLAAIALYSEVFSWQTAITATYFAFSYDVLDRKILPIPVMWTLIILSTLLISVLVSKRPDARFLFTLLTWTAVANALRYLIGPLRSEPVTMLIVFTVMAAILTASIYRPAAERKRSAMASD